MNTAPDRIYIDRVDTRQLQTGVRNALHAFVQLDSTPVTVKYLRATPEREAAGEMREALEKIAIPLRFAVGIGATMNPEDLLKTVESALPAARREGGDE